MSSIQSREELADILHRIGNLRVMVVGDSMLDIRETCSPSGKTAETGGQVMKVSRTVYAPGGAANVYMNLLGIGCEAVLCTVVGDDDEGDKLEKELSFYRGKLNRSYWTTVKHSVCNEEGRCVFRLDKDAVKTDRIEDVALAARLMQDMESHQTDILIIQDYGKGVVSPTMLATIREVLHNLPDTMVCYDPHISTVGNVPTGIIDVLKPNRKEADALIENLSVEYRRDLIETYGLDVLLVTEGADGMEARTSYDAMKEGGHEESVMRQPVVGKEQQRANVCGAGDTVLAAFSLVYKVTKNVEKSMEFAAAAASVALASPGTIIVTAEDIVKVYEQELFQ